MRPAKLAGSVFIVLSFLCVPNTSPAEEHSGPESSGEDEESHGSAEPHESHSGEHARNAVALVIGGTYESEEEKTFFTFGAEYERFLSPRFGIVVGAEYITEVDALIGALPFVYRHASGWRLLGGPGVEFKTRRPPEGEGSADTEPPRWDENLFLWRLGVAYNFPIEERYAVAPALNFDFVREDGHWVEALVFTVSFGHDF